MERQRDKYYSIITQHEEKGNIQMIAPTRGAA